MYKVIPFFFLFVFGCSNSNQHNEYDPTHTSPKIMHFDLQYDYNKAKAAFESNNLAELDERMIWQEQSMQGISTANNDQPYFYACKAAYEDLNVLMYMYDKTLRFDWKKSSDIAEREKLVEKGISRCQSFVPS